MQGSAGLSLWSRSPRNSSFIMLPQGGGNRGLPCDGAVGWNGPVGARLRAGEIPLSCLSPFQKKPNPTANKTPLVKVFRLRTLFNPEAELYLPFPNVVTWMMTENAGVAIEKGCPRLFSVSSQRASDFKLPECQPITFCKSYFY